MHMHTYRHVFLHTHIDIYIYIHIDVYIYIFGGRERVREQMRQKCKQILHLDKRYKEVHCPIVVAFLLV